MDINPVFIEKKHNYIYLSKLEDISIAEDQ